MGHIFRMAAGLFFVLLMATLAAAQIRVEPVKPLPAWCGGSYSLSGGLDDRQYIEAIKAGQSVAGGTNFAACVDVVKEVRALDGKMTTVSIPTYPAAPASQVSFQADGRVLFSSGEVDKDGKAIVEELKLPDIPK